MKRFILLMMSGIVGIIMPAVIAYSLYSTPEQKNSVPVWLLAVLGVVALVVVKIAWTWLVESSSIAIRILLLFGVVDFLIIQSYFIIKRIEMGEIVMSDNMLFLIGSTTIAGLFALWATLLPDKDVDVDVDVEVENKINK